MSRCPTPPARRSLAAAAAALAALAACKPDDEPVPSRCVAAAELCADLELQVPSPRGEVAGVWDGTRQRLVVFGGDEGSPVQCIPAPDFVGQTWEWRSACDAWVELETDEAPHARGRHVAAMDAEANRMLLHGGRFRETGTSGDYELFDDLWAFDLDGDTWVEVASGGGGDGPSPRANHAGVVAGDRFVLFGGNESEDPLVFQPLGDVWAFDLESEDWEELEPLGDEAPVARLYHAMAASPDGRTVYVYGGGGANAFQGPFYGDLWALDLDTMEWDELDGGGGDAGERPDHRIWASLLADPDGARLWLWAGHDDQALGNRNDLWVFDLDDGGWEQVVEGDALDQGAAGFCEFPADFVEPDLGAPERRNAGAAAITDCSEIVMFAGKTDCGIANDLWVWSESGGWDERSPATAGEICLRSAADCEEMCF
jgi:hypothetical protein